MPRPPRSSLFPYTTLFRSVRRRGVAGHPVDAGAGAREIGAAQGADHRGDRRRAGARLYRRQEDRKSTRLNSSHVEISYAVFCLKKKTTKQCSPAASLSTTT